MAISSSEPKKRTINKTTEQMNTTIWVIIWVTIVLGSMIINLVCDFNKKDQHRAARKMIDELRARGGNLLRHISSICPEKDRSYLRQIASVLTLGELIDGLRDFSRRRNEEIKIFLEPHLMRCNSFEDLTRLEDELESIDFQIRYFYLTSKSAKQWLRFSQSYSVACSRFKELEYPKWGRPIIEQFGSEALQHAKKLREIHAVLTAFEIKYPSHSGSQVKYCPIYYQALEKLRELFRTKIEKMQNIRSLALIMASIDKFKPGEDIYRLALDKANTKAKEFSLHDVISQMEGPGLSEGAEKVAAEEIIYWRLLNERIKDLIAEEISRLTGRNLETAEEMLEASVI